MNNLFTTRGILIICCLSMFWSSLDAQKCRTSEIRKAKIEKHPELKNQLKALELKTQEWIKANPLEANPRAVITLPIVVHVLHNAPDENISDEQIMSQIEVLNKDFRQLNTNFNSTPTPFKQVAADTEIEFCLASVDPSGNSTNGITRTSVMSNFDIENDYWDGGYGGKDPWDVNKYINIWIGKLSIGNLGFATPPGTAYNGNDDGIVIDYRAWGTIGTAEGNAPNNLGRTATHEMGHYLNLEHLWGPGNGGCNQDDFVNDTPEQDKPNYDCPSYPEVDNCTNGFGLMFMNFLDYSDDVCMTMFSQGQKARMLAALNGPRASLLNSNACGLTSSTQLIEAESINVYPNPARDLLFIETENLDDVQIEVINANGQILHNSKYKNSELIKINIKDFEQGIYFLKIISGEQIITQKILKTI